MITSSVRCGISVDYFSISITTQVASSRVSFPLVLFILIMSMFPCLGLSFVFLVEMLFWNVILRCPVTFYCVYSVVEKYCIKIQNIKIKKKIHLWSSKLSTLLRCNCNISCFTAQLRIMLRSKLLSCSSRQRIRTTRTTRSRLETPRPLLYYTLRDKHKNTLWKQQ